MGVVLLRKKWDDKMELDIEQLYREIFNLKILGSKEPSTRIINRYEEEIKN